jgi:diguanylate cyclase (GGDEF)-like protein/PAS domain S-box-containing protein
LVSTVPNLHPRPARTAPPAAPTLSWNDRAMALAPVGIFQTDPDGACLTVNDRWCEYAGMTADQARGSGWLAAIHPDDRERVRDEWAAAVAERRDFELEYRFRRPDGVTTWLAGSATALVDADGRVLGYVGTATRIDTAVAARRELADQRQFVDAVIDVAGSLVCVFDPEGRFLRFNRACELVSGYTFEEIQGRPFYDFLIPDDEIVEVREALGRLRAGEPPTPNVNNWVTRDGALRLIAWSDVCLFDAEGSLTYIVSTGTDITDERRAQEALRGIEAVGAVLAADGPTPESMATVLRTLSDKMGYRQLALYLLDDDRLHLGAQLGYTDLPRVMDPTASVIGRVFGRGEAVLVPDVTTDPDYVTFNEDVRSLIVASLVHDGQAIGALAIAGTVTAPVTEPDLHLAITIAERLAVAVALGREQQAIADRARLFAALASFAEVANSTLATEQLIPALLGAVDAILPADVLGLVVLERSTGRYVVRAARGGLDSAAIGTEVRIGDGVSGRALASRSMIFGRANRSRYATGLRDFITPESLSMAAVPLIRDGAMLGVIVLGRTTPREPAFSSLETEALTLIAAQTALALANAHLLEEVSELAIRDALTGLYNRRHFDASLEHILRRRQRTRASQPPVAAIMFDLDHFGRFNKDHGHQAGDAVLRAFAGILLERFRSSDLVARYGGEEFVAILEGSTGEDAVRVADEVRRTLAASRITGPDGMVLRATVSAGCAVLGDDDQGREALIQAADVGLFMAKRAGRNRVVAV